jgi:hypothetical protein
LTEYFTFGEDIESWIAFKNMKKSHKSYQSLFIKNAENAQAVIATIERQSIADDRNQGVVNANFVACNMGRDPW